MQQLNNQKSNYCPTCKSRGGSIRDDRPDGMIELYFYNEDKSIYLSEGLWIHVAHTKLRDLVLEALQKKQTSPIWMDDDYAGFKLILEYI